MFFSVFRWKSNHFPVVQVIMQIYLRAAIFWKRWEKTLSSLVWGKVKNAAGESLNNKKLICHSQRRCDFANDVKSSKYNHLETVLGYNVFSGTPVSTTTAALREKCSYSEFFWSVFSHIQTRKTSITGTFHVVLFLRNSWPMKGIKPYFQPGPLSDILTIANLWHAGSRVSTCTEAEFRLCWMKVCNSDNHYTAAPILKSEENII